ncbi:MAG TPA: hypothetical protein VK177_19725 [Flavobacteriales bacterium]|nr:hypothetical protein [Flavobacteriales bacterium]
MVLFVTTCQAQVVTDTIVPKEYDVPTGASIKINDRFYLGLPLSVLDEIEAELKFADEKNDKVMANVMQMYLDQYNQNGELVLRLKDVLGFNKKTRHFKCFEFMYNKAKAGEVNLTEMKRIEDLDEMMPVSHEKFVVKLTKLKGVAKRQWYTVNAELIFEE